MQEQLESILIENFNPDFLAYEFLDKETINLVISSKCFLNQQMGERIRSVYSCVEQKLPALMNEYVLYVNAFTENELNDLRDYYQINNEA